MRPLTVLYRIIFLLVICWSLQNCQKADNRTESSSAVTIATVGHSSVDWDMIWQSFHLDPKYTRGFTNKEAMLNQLEHLIEQKMLAQEARKAGADTLEEIAGYLRFIKEKEMIKALYRREIESAVEISEEEYQQAYQKLKTKVQLQYISSNSPESALAYRELLRTEDFAQIMLKNPSREEKSTTPLFGFGDMDERLENIAFNLQLNEVAGPIRIENRYMVIKLIGGQRDKFTSANDYAQNKHRLYNVISQRKAAKLSDNYIHSLLKGRQIRIKAGPFNTLKNIFAKIVDNKTSDKPFPLHLSNPEIDKASASLSDIADAVLVTFDDHQATVKDFLTQLANMPAGLRPKVNMAGSLKKAIAVFVRNSYLTEVAYAANLDTAEDVVREAQRQTDEVLARYWLKKIRNGVSISQTEVDAFKTTDNYRMLIARFKDKLDDKMLRDLMLDQKFTSMRITIADSLHTIYRPAIDSSAFMTHLAQSGDPEAIIDNNQMQIFYREKFQ